MVKKTKKAVVTKKEDPVKLQEKQKHKEIFYWQRDIIMQMLEELFVRQCVCDETEADDFIGCIHPTNPRCSIEQM